MFEEAEVPKDHSQKLQIQARSKQPTVSKLSGPFQPKDPSWQSLQSIEIQWQANPSGSSIIRHRGWNIEVPKDHSLTLEVGYNQPTVSTPLTFLPKDRRYIQTDNTVDYSYDVFINYKYETHTRNPNSMLLQEGLEEAGFRTFMQTSHEGPWRAEIDTIRNSMCAIVLITRNYTAYHTGLEELLYILKKCKRDSTFALVPVYLDVDPGDAIWYEKGDSGCALENHRSNFGRKINKWKAAMEEVWQSFEPYTLTRKKSVKKIVQAVKYHLEMAAQKLLSNQF